MRHCVDCGVVTLSPLQVKVVGACCATVPCRAYAILNPALITLHVVCEVASDNFSLNEHICVTVQGLVFVANLWFGGFPDPVNPGRPEWSKVQTRGKPLVATAQAKYVSAGE